MDPSADLEIAFDTAVTAYFDRVLPSFLTAHLRGGGYTLVAEVMCAHDSGDLLSICDTVRPTDKSVTRARRVRAQCPPRLMNGGFNTVLGPPMLGLFQRRGTTISGEMLHSYREVDVSWEVSIFADTFLATVPPERWAEELLLTLFHEYIHYFESFLLRSEQPLRSREEGHHGVAERALSIDEARQRDRKIVRRRRLFWGGLIAILLLVVGTVVMLSIRIESRADRDRMQAALTENAALMTRWDALEARRAELEAAAHRLQQANAPAFNITALLEVARDRCPLSQVQRIGRLETVVITGRDDWQVCLLRLERSVPKARVTNMTTDGRTYRMLLKPAGGGMVGLGEIRQPWRAPDITTDEGDALREALAASADQLRRRSATVRPLARLERQIDAIQATTPPSLARLVMQLPDSVNVRAIRSVKAGIEVHIDGPGAATWIRENHPPDGQARVFGDWYLAAAKSGPGLTGRVVHRAWFTPR